MKRRMRQYIKRVVIGALVGAFVLVALGQFCGTEPVDMNTSPAIAITGDAPPVKVDAFIEALCVDTKRFVLSSLIKTYRMLGSDVISLTLVPFGKAHTNLTNHTVTCQHGPAECDANAYEQCLINSYPDPLWYLYMIECLFTKLPMGYNETPFSRNVFASCSYEAGLDFYPIQMCRGNPFDTWKLQLQAEEATPTYLNHVPWIEINGRRMDEEKESFDVAVCKAYVASGGKSDVCEEITRDKRTITNRMREWFKSLCSCRK